MGAPSLVGLSAALELVADADKLSRHLGSEEPNGDEGNYCDQSDEQCVLNKAGAFFVGYKAALESRQHAKHFCYLLYGRVIQ